MPGFLDRRLLRNLDYYTLLITLAIMLFGLVVIASATQARWGDWDSFYYVKRQLLWIIVALAALFFSLFFDYALLKRYSNILYVFMLLMLLGVFFLGQSGQGAQRWIQLGPFQVQPSEFAKILVILTLAGHLARRNEEMQGWLVIVSSFLHVAFPMVLILKQPDLGTSLVFLAILFGMLYMAGVPGRRLLAIGTAGLTAAVGAVMLHLRYGMWIPLQDYQLTRLIVFTDPTNPKYIYREGYHIYQSRLAIGSGRLFGQGLFSGRQTQLNFLPEQHTDFIFTVVGEELGFIGATIVLLALFLLLLRCLRVATEAKDTFGALIVAGVVSMIGFHVLVNVGMTVGIMPVTGLPLPFLSYGGSSLLANSLGIGLILNIFMRRRKILF